MLDIDAYLHRINYTGPREPSAATLAALHEAHMLAVPFENLDIVWQRPLSLDQDALFDKIVRRGRGGFCYELNGLFAALLRALGFEVTLLSASVYNDGAFGPDFDHLALRVQAEGAWLADVGFGDCFLRPLRLEAGEQPQPDRGMTYRLTPNTENWVLDEQRAGAPWEPVYRFSLQPRCLEDFAAMCHFQQTSPDSAFTRKRVCSRATPTGRISLRNQQLIVTAGDQRREQDLPDDAAFAAALREHFGIVQP